MSKASTRHTRTDARSRAGTKTSRVLSRKASKIVTKRAFKAVGRKTSKAATRKTSKVLGTTSDGVRILKPKGRATHFTMPQLEAAISRVRAKRAPG
jgi:hypothetical protein